MSRTSRGPGLDEIHQVIFDRLCTLRFPSKNKEGCNRVTATLAASSPELEPRVYRGAQLPELGRRFVFLCYKGYLSGQC